VDRDALHDAMGVALEEGGAALEHGDVPIGAVIVRLDSGEIVARRHNERELSGDPTAHAEVLALRDAARSAGSWRLAGHALVVTVEPCAMCAGAAMSARVDRVVFGAADPKAGAFGSLYNLGVDPRLNHSIEIVDGIRADAAAALVAEFFATRRGR
jgi:tRNA(adenine34) deaminase